MIERELGRALLEAVPQLPAPPDRLRAVGARVRRQRGGVAALTAVVVALALGVPAILAPVRSPAPAGPEVLGPDGCPVPGRVHRASTMDTAGPLVPAGATEVVLCETAAEQRVLTQDVSSFVALLNQLPTTDKQSAYERFKREFADGSPDPGPPSCSWVYYPVQRSLVFRYPDRAPVPVLLDRNCDRLISDGHIRFGATAAVAQFLSRYRQQLIDTTDPATIATPGCEDRGSIPGAPDTISGNRADGEPPLPSALVAVTACRYTDGPYGIRLAAQWQTRDRSTVESWRAALNIQLGGGPAQPCTGAGSPDRLDTVLVADVTGGRRQLWVLRGMACPASPELLTMLDATLGK
jgi:hypothetical protein